jgi:hypothetical protein
MPVHGPHTVAFDVVETLISLEPLRDRFVEIGLPATTLERWFTLMLRDGMALTLAGGYQPFPAVAESALRVIGGGRLTDEAPVDMRGPLERFERDRRAGEATLPAAGGGRPDRAASPRRSRR